MQWGKTTTKNSDTSIQNLFPTSFTSADSWMGATMNVKNRPSTAAVKLFPAGDGAYFYAISPGYSDEVASWIAIGYQTNGLLMQWGSVTASISKTDYKDFPTSFSSKNSWFAATQSNQSETSVALGKMLKGTSGANFLPWARSGSNNYSDTFEYIAIGYQLNGLIMQWGTIIPTSQATKDGTLTFPIKFSQIPFFQATRRRGNSDSITLNQDQLAIGYVSETTARYDANRGAPYAENNPLILDWFAIGYQPNGLIIQWGKCEHNVNICFPTAFNDTPFLNMGSATSARVMSYRDLKDSGFTPWFQKFGEGYYGGEGFYFAIGT